MTDPWREQLSAVYQDHRRGLLALAAAVTGCRQRAEDAVHEAFTRLCRRPRELSGGLAAYVYAAVRNAAVDQHRRGRPGVAQTSLFEPADPAPGPHARAEQSEAQHRLMQAIDRLEPDDKQVLILRVFAGMTVEQIATTVSAPRTTVSSRYHRVLARLREQLSPASLQPECSP